jgi:hypothetical protein
MPDDYFPTHFLSWLTYGPAADNQHPLWLSDTGKAVLKIKTDILESTSSISMGRSSSYSRKMQRQEAMEKSESKVLDLTANDDISNRLLRDSVRNSSEIVSLLRTSTDNERMTIDALVLNASRMYELDSTEENKAEYIRSLKKQRELLVLRSATPLPLSAPEGAPATAPVSMLETESFVAQDTAEDIDGEYQFNEIDDNIYNDGMHNLYSTFSNETFEV